MTCLHRNKTACANPLMHAGTVPITDDICARCPFYSLTVEQSVALVSKPYTGKKLPPRWRTFTLAIFRAVAWTLRNRRLPWLVGLAYRQRLEVCRSNRCGKYLDGRCMQCGCNTASDNRVLDKARWPAETCPAGLWPR